MHDLRDYGSHQQEQENTHENAGHKSGFANFAHCVPLPLFVFGDHRSSFAFGGTMKVYRYPK